MKPTNKLAANKLLTENIPEAVTEIVPKNDTVSLYSLLKDFASMTTIDTTTPDYNLEPRRNIVTDFVTTTKKNRWIVFLFLLKHGCATAKNIFTITQLKRRTVYRVLEDFRIMGLARYITKLKGFPGANHAGVLYGLPDCTEQQVIDAISLYRRISSPFFKPAEKLAMDFMEYELQPSKATKLNTGQVRVWLMNQEIPTRNRLVTERIIIMLLKENGYIVRY